MPRSLPPRRRHGTGYVLGTAPSAGVASRLASGGPDVRVAGSGNPGGLNAARVLERPNR